MKLFPRRPTPFEFYMLADNRPDYPMTIPIRLHFAGRLDLDRLRAAAVAIRSAHPMLAAHIRRPGAWTAAGATWIDAGPHEPPLELAPDGPDTPVFIDLTNSVGWRGWLTPGPTGDTLTLLFHHACTDGRGAMLFIADLLATYDNPSAAPPAVDPDAVHAWQYVAASQHLRRLGADLRRIIRFFRTQPRPLATGVPRASRQLRKTGDGWHSVDLTRAETAGLLTAARNAGVTLNTLLLRDLYETLFTWNAQRDAPAGGGSPPDGAVRVAVPVDLRDGPPRTANNGAGFVCLDRRPEHATSLLESLAAEMAGVRRLGTGHALIQVLRVAARVPGGMAALTGTGCKTTAIFSNLGRLLEELPQCDADGRLRVGSATLESVDVMAPVRAMTPAGFAALTYAGRLTLTLSTDTAVLSDTEAAELLAAFAARVRAAGGRPAAGVIARSAGGGRGDRSLAGHRGLCR